MLQLTKIKDTDYFTFTFRAWDILCLDHLKTKTTLVQKCYCSLIIFNSVQIRVYKGWIHTVWYLTGETESFVWNNTLNRDFFLSLPEFLSDKGQVKDHKCRGIFTKGTETQVRHDLHGLSSVCKLFLHLLADQWCITFQRRLPVLKNMHKKLMWNYRWKQ